jgi:hypothetical protein
VELEDTGFVFAPRSTEPVTSLREVAGDGLDSLSEPLQLGFYLILCYPVSLGLGPADSGHERRPHGHSL